LVIAVIAAGAIIPAAVLDPHGFPPYFPFFQAVIDLRLPYEFGGKIPATDTDKDFGSP
jgi:hypothetical protein